MEKKLHNFRTKKIVKQFCISIYCPQKDSMKHFLNWIIVQSLFIIAFLNKNMGHSMLNVPLAKKIFLAVSFKSENKR